MYQTLISAEQLQSEIQSQRPLVILDCRFNLMAPEQGREQYLADHLPGAQYVDLNTQLSSAITADSGRHPLPQQAALVSLFSSLGIDDQVQVVVYDDCAGGMAARAWWLLQWLGHRNAALLDGAIQAWQAAGFAQEQGEGSEPQARHFDVKASAFTTLSTAQVLAGDYRLVDARAAARFNGEQEPIDPVAGHIPHAINRPFQANLTPQGLFKSQAQLAQELASLDSPEVAQMCGSGVTACHNILAMCHANLAPSKLYAGSWSEWIVDSTRPIARAESSAES